MCTQKAEGEIEQKQEQEQEQEEGKKKGKKENSPKPLINDLTPAIPIEELRTQLTRAQKPLRAIRVRRIKVYCRSFLATITNLSFLLQTLSQAPQVPVHAFARRRSADILNVRRQCIPEPADDLGGRDVGVGHGVAERDAGGGDGAAGLRAAQLEAAGGS